MGLPVLWDQSCFVCFIHFSLISIHLKSALKYWCMHSDTNRIWTLQHNKKKLWKLLPVGRPTKTKDVLRFLVASWLRVFMGKLSGMKIKSKPCLFCLSHFSIIFPGDYTANSECVGGGTERVLGMVVVVGWGLSATGAGHSEDISPHLTPLLPTRFFTVYTLHSLFPSYTPPHTPTTPTHPPRWQPLPQAPAGSMHRPTYLNIRGTGWRIACKADCS